RGARRKSPLRLFPLVAVWTRAVSVGVRVAGHFRSLLCCWSSRTSVMRMEDVCFRVVGSRDDKSNLRPLPPWAGGRLDLQCFLHEKIYFPPINDRKHPFVVGDKPSIV